VAGPYATLDNIILPPVDPPFARTSTQSRVRLMDSLTFAGCVLTSNLSTAPVPESGLSSVDRILTTVVLPALLEPNRAKMLPRATSKSTPAQHSQIPVRLLQTLQVDRPV
jgi:hypothetical protein